VGNTKALLAKLLSAGERWCLLSAVQ